MSLHSTAVLTVRIMETERNLFIHCYSASVCSSYLVNLKHFSYTFDIMHSFIIHSHTHSFTSSNSQNESTDKQLNNPMYDTNTEAHNYSSSGPTYELIDSNKKAEQIYDLLEQCKEAKTTTGDEENFYHVLESGGHDYEVPMTGPMSQQTHSRALKKK